MRQTMNFQNKPDFTEEAAEQHNQELLYKILDAMYAAQTAHDRDCYLTEDGIAGTTRIMDVLMDTTEELFGYAPDIPEFDVEDADTYILPFTLAMFYARLSFCPMAGDDLSVLAELEYLMDAILSGDWFGE